MRSYFTKLGLVIILFSLKPANAQTTFFAGESFNPSLEECVDPIEIGAAIGLNSDKNHADVLYVYDSTLLIVRASAVGFSCYARNLK